VLRPLGTAIISRNLLVRFTPLELFLKDNKKKQKKEEEKTRARTRKKEKERERNKTKKQTEEDLILKISRQGEERS